MLRTTREEWYLAQSLPPEGMTVGELHIGLQSWTHAQTGVVIELSLADDAPASYVWLAEAGWLAWCDTMLGTADVKSVNAVLLEGLAEWALSPLLAESQARVIRQNTSPQSCSYLPEQWGIVLGWQMEQVTFQAVIFGNTDTWFKHLRALIPPDTVPMETLPPLQCTLYAGECEIPLSALQRITLGDGIAMRPFGCLRTGNFILSPLLDGVAYVQMNGDGTMSFTALRKDTEGESVETPDEHACEAAMSIDLDALPQKLLVEVGQVEMTLGSLRTLQVGDTVEVNVEFASEATLKLNGRAIGKGALISCGDRFLVQIRHWYLSAPDKMSATKDGVIAR